MEICLQLLMPEQAYTGVSEKAPRQKLEEPLLHMVARCWQWKPCPPQLSGTAAQKSAARGAVTWASHVITQLLAQGFSATPLLTFWTRQLFVMEAALCPVECSLVPLAFSHEMPVVALPSCDNKKHLQTLPNVLRKATPSSVKDHYATLPIWTSCFTSLNLSLLSVRGG